MSTYKITVANDRVMNDYIQGRISGAIYALSGMPEIEYVWMRNSKGHFEYQCFECTDEQYKTIVDAIWKMYGNIIRYEIEEIYEKES